MGAQVIDERASRASLGPRSVVGVLADMDSAAILVHQERCAKVRNRNVSCARCADACTSGCISLVDGLLTVDASKCVGCGTCATVCPTCALEARNPSDAELLDACLAARLCGTEADDGAAGVGVTGGAAGVRDLCDGGGGVGGTGGVRDRGDGVGIGGTGAAGGDREGGSRVIVVCEQLRAAAAPFLDEKRVAHVVCAGRVEECLLSGLALRGVTNVQVACGRCSSCAQRHGLDTARAVADTAATLFSAWDLPLRVDVVEGVPRAALADESAAEACAEAVASYFAEPRGNRPIANRHAEYDEHVSRETSSDAPDSALASAPAPTAAPEATPASAASPASADAPMPASSSASTTVSTAEPAFDLALSERDASVSRETSHGESACNGNASRETCSAPSFGASPSPTAALTVPTPTGPVAPAHAASSSPAAAPAAGGLRPGLQRVMRDGTLPHFVPDRRERLLDNLLQAGSPQVDTLRTRLWGSVVIDGRKCSSCRMCATFCPTGAIRKFDLDDGTFGVDHYPGDCVKCGSCRDVCAEDAIMLLDDVKSDYLANGGSHHYIMRPRAVELGSAQQILNTMRQRMKGSDIFER